METFYFWKDLKTKMKSCLKSLWVVVNYQQQQLQQQQQQQRGVERLSSKLTDLIWYRLSSCQVKWSVMRFRLTGKYKSTVLKFFWKYFDFIVFSGWGWSRLRMLAPKIHKKENDRIFLAHQIGQKRWSRVLFF